MQPPLLIIFCNNLIDISYFSEDRVEVYKVTSFDQEEILPMDYDKALLEANRKKDNDDISIGFAEAKREHYRAVGR